MAAAKRARRPGPADSGAGYRARGVDERSRGLDPGDLPWGLRQSFGIGVNGAAVQLAAVGHHPERIRSETAFAAICAADPLEASFSNTRHHGQNRGGHRQANVTLHRLAVVRLRWHEQTKAYAERRKAEGRSNKDIRRCLKRFIARGVLQSLMGKPLRRTAAR